MRSARSSLIIASVIILGGCSSEHEPTTPRPPAATLNTSRAVVISVNGGGIVDFSTAGVGNGHFSFHASVRADGTVEGRFHQRREANGLVIDFTGRVTCLTIDPVLRRGRIGGVVTENNSTHPNFLTANHEVGDDVWFRFEDGGEGAGAVDASTTYGFVPTLVTSSAAYCALPFTGLPAWNPASIFPLRSGNIQIRP